MAVWSVPGGRNLFDAHAGDAIAVHLQDGEAAPLVLDGGAGLGNIAQTEEEEPGEGFEAGVGRNIDAVLAFQVADASGTSSSTSSFWAPRRATFSSCSSSIRPTICSRTSSTVSMPTMVPNSSTTIAR